MTGGLALRDRRALLLGAMVVAGVVVGFRGPPAWRRWRAEARRAAAEMMSRVARTEAALAGFSSSLDSLEARTGRLRNLAPALLSGETPSEAASNLAGVVLELARMSSVRLDAVDVRIDTAGALPLPRVTVEAQATADIVGLASLIHAIERGPTLLAVRRLAVRPQTLEGPSDKVETLVVRFTVEGLALIRKEGAMP